MRGAALVMKNPLKGKEKVGNKADRVIMHVDFDAFFRECWSSWPSPLAWKTGGGVPLATPRTKWSIEHK